ncbi:MAG: DUF4240 domain-containing protein [Saprospirales bacterium]|nr:DUF4240 domain-containing protein [Saprospirales bacterium]
MKNTLNGLLNLNPSAMTDNEKGKNLHDRACRGELLTEEERQFLDRWYAKMDLEESLALGFPNRINIPLAHVNEAFIQALREKYPGNIRLDIQIVDLNDAPSFTEEDFWKIIDQIIPDEDAGEEALEASVHVLSERPVSHIYLFEDRLAEKLFLLDTEAHARAAYPDGHISADGFLYARAAVVAGGKTRYEAVLNNPSLMPVDEGFEALLSLAGKAFQRKTGEEFQYIPIQCYETFSNPEGWEETWWERLE